MPIEVIFAAVAAGGVGLFEKGDAGSEIEQDEVSFSRFQDGGDFFLKRLSDCEPDFASSHLGSLARGWLEDVRVCSDGDDRLHFEAIPCDCPSEGAIGGDARQDKRL